MARKQAPRPPQTDNPIEFSDPMSGAIWHEMFAELLAAEEARDLELAARHAATALTKKNVPRELVGAMVGKVHNLAVTENHFPAAVKTLLCKAVDEGFHLYAYTAANIVRDEARSARDYRQAERYFKIAMSFTEDPARQAAAHVNYGRMVREGLISGTPDLRAVVEIFEVAARMGLVKGMYLAGETSSLLAQEGDRAYGARAVYWFKKAMETRVSNTPTLDYESKVELEKQVYENCMFELSALNIDEMYDGANVEEGIRWGRELAERGSARARRNLQIAYMRRLMDMTTPPVKSPGGNWKSVLSQMDWVFEGKLRTITFPVVLNSDEEDETIKVDVLTVSLRKGKQIPLFVVHDACLPAQGGFELLSAVAQVLHKRHPEGFFLLGRKALYIEQHEMAYTPVYVMQEGRISPQALWLGCWPDEVLQRAKEGAEFLDERFGIDNCILPIAVNTLDEGYVVATDAVLEQPCVGVGESWRMPYIDRNRLSEWSIFFDGDRVLMLSRKEWEPRVG